MPVCSDAEYSNIWLKRGPGFRSDFISSSQQLLLSLAASLKEVDRTGQQSSHSCLREMSEREWREATAFRGDAFSFATPTGVRIELH